MSRSFDHNPQTGHELSWGNPVPAERSLDVAVVGGGPAGLEAARVAALRGHRVTLHEQSEHLGGQLHTWTRLASKRELRAIVEWQQRQLERLQVRIRLGHRVASAQDLGGVEVVVLASGARPGPVPMDGAAEHGVSVCTAHDVLDSAPVSAARAFPKTSLTSFHWQQKGHPDSSPDSTGQGIRTTLRGGVEDGFIPRPRRFGNCRPRPR